MQRGASGRHALMLPARTGTMGEQQGGWRFGEVPEKGRPSRGGAKFPLFGGFDGKEELPAISRLCVRHKKGGCFWGRP